VEDCQSKFKENVYCVVLVDRIYNCSVSVYDDGCLLYLQCNFL